MSYPVRFEDEAISDVQALPDRETQFAALRVARDLAQNPHLGERLRNRSRIGDLTICRAVRFDKEGRRGKPRYRLVYRLSRSGRLQFWKRLPNPGRRHLPDTAGIDW